MWSMFFKYGQNLAFLFIFVLFQCNDKYSVIDNKWKKHRWCARDSNPGLQDREAQTNLQSCGDPYFLWSMLPIKSKVSR